MDNTNQLCVSSYNSGGFGLDKQEFISHLQLFSDIVCVQEHFVLNSGSRKYNNTEKIRSACGDNFNMFITPAVKDNNVLTRGRGKGGLITMWKKCLSKYVSQIKCENFRIQATQFTFPQSSLLLINLYLMNDPQHDFNDQELLQTLAEINDIIRQNMHSSVLICGDLNCDFRRNTQFVNSISGFVNNLNYQVIWNQAHINQNIQEIDYTYSKTINGITHCSTIDHFISNETFYNSITEAGKVNCPNNTSNHHPIFCKFNVDNLNRSYISEIPASKPSWRKANEAEKSEFKNYLDIKLQEINIPVNCENCKSMHCSLHSDEIEDYSMKICESIELAAKECLPWTNNHRQNRKRTMPGWNEYVRPYQEESKFWYGLWRAAGAPNNGELYDTMKRFKMQYKYAVRRLKRGMEGIQNDKFLNGVLNGGQDIFAEIKKIRGNVKVTSNCVDGVTGSENISNTFANIYQELYSRHEDKTAELDSLERNISEKITEEHILDVTRITTTDVKKALLNLKPGKSDNVFYFTSDCIQNSSDLLINHVTKLFQYFVLYGNVPTFLLICTLIPIIKDNLGDTASSENYRAIAIGNLILKWFDSLILIMENDKLNMDELQFGFQKGTGTNMCSWAITSVIDYYNRAGRPVFACSMDLSKAFDVVSWIQLFKELEDREVSPAVLRTLLYIYRGQTYQVQWNNSVSRRFKVYNGVKQGAVSSPILFCIYMNKLISRLRFHGSGCQLGGVFMGIFIYADDIILLAPSRNGLQNMVKICEQFANLFSMKFSTNNVVEKSKTKCIIFTKYPIDTVNILPIYLNDVPLPYVDHVKHLGCTLQTDNSFTRDINQKRGQFIAKIHSLNQEFYFADSTVLIKLYNLYATSIYGSNLWNLFSNDVFRIYSSWNTAVRIVFKLPNTCHRYFIEPLSQSSHLMTMFCSRFVSFISSLENSSKICIRLLINLLKFDQRSVTAKNLRNIADRCNKDLNIIDKCIVKNCMTFQEIPLEEEWRIPFLNELISAKNNKIVINGVDQAEIDDIINFICTT